MRPCHRRVARSEVTGQGMDFLEFVFLLNSPDLNVGCQVGGFFQDIKQNCFSLGGILGMNGRETGKAKLESLFFFFLVFISMYTK